LCHSQISNVDDEFALSKDGVEMFGVLDLATAFERCRFAIPHEGCLVITRSLWTDYGCLRCSIAAKMEKHINQSAASFELPRKEILQMY